MPTLRGWTEESMSPWRSIQRGKIVPGITEAVEVGRSTAPSLGNNTAKVAERSRRQGLEQGGKGEGLLWEKQHYALGGSQ